MADTEIETTLDKVAALTEYVILRRDNGSLDTWKRVERVQASSADAAVRRALKKATHEGAATFVAVPDRSWKPVTVTTKTTTTLDLKPAT